MDFLTALKTIRGGLDHLEFHSSGKGEPKGWGGFRDRLLALKAKRNIGSYAAVVLMADNDEDPERRAMELRQKVGETEIFNSPDATWMGSVRNTLPSVHIVTLPAKHEAGSLETLLMRAIEEQNAPAKKCADAYFAAFDKIDDAGRCSTSKRAKLRLRIELAATIPTDPLIPFEKLWVSDEQRPRDIVGLNHAAFDELYTYLQRLGS